MLGQKRSSLRSDATGQQQQANRAPQVTCEGCTRRFTIELKERPLPGGGAQQRFKCPHCGKYYLVANISAEGVKIRQQLKGIEAQLKEKPGDAGLVAEMGRLKELLSREVTK